MARKKCETAEESILYRKPMQVKEILVYRGKMYDFHKKYTFPICPKCDTPMEYEYQRFCSSCGQKLSWLHYGKAKLRYPGMNKK